MAAGRRAKAAQGEKATGCYPYGWYGVDTSHGRKTQEHPEEQATIRLMVDYRNQGMPLRAIAMALDAAHRSPRKAKSWSSATVGGILKRQLQPGSFAPLVSSTQTSGA